MRNSLEELTRNNTIHIDVHGPLDEKDVADINRISDLIENSRGVSPKAGDAVEIFTRDGMYYPHAHIEEIHTNGKVIVCASGGRASVNSEGGMSRVSGGPWMTLDVSQFVPNGEYVKDFMFFRPAAFFPAHAMVDFQVKVKYWKYAEPDPLYGEFSGKDYDIWRHHVFPGRKINGYRHFVGSLCFCTKTDYLAWLATYKGVEFAGECYNTVFTYRKAENLIGKAEWDALGLPIDTRIINASIVPIKYQVDDEKHLITEYRYTNHCEKSEYIGPEYRVARNLIDSGAFKHTVLSCVSPQDN